MGELEDLIAAAFRQGPPTMQIEDAVPFLAAALAPHIVLRDQLEHVGWTCEVATGLSLHQEQCPEGRPVFCIPPRTVKGNGEMVIPFGAGSVV